VKLERAPIAYLLFLNLLLVARSPAADLDRAVASSGRKLPHRFFERSSLRHISRTSHSRWPAARSYPNRGFKDSLHPTLFAVKRNSGPVAEVSILLAGSNRARRQRIET
jgi:hypothetical protein